MSQDFDSIDASRLSDDDLDAVSGGASDPKEVSAKSQNAKAPAAPPPPAGKGGPVIFTPTPPTPPSVKSPAPTTPPAPSGKSGDKMKGP